MQNIKQRRSKDFQRCRRCKLNKKIKEARQDWQRAKDICKGKYFLRKTSQDSTHATFFRCGSSCPHTALWLAIEKTCNYFHKENHCERWCRNKYRLKARYGKSFNHLTASSSIFNSESASDNKVFTIQALLPEVSDNKKVFVEKNDTKEPLPQKTDNEELIT